MIRIIVFNSKHSKQLFSQRIKCEMVVDWRQVAITFNYLHIAKFRHKTSDCSIFPCYSRNIFKFNTLSNALHFHTDRGFRGFHFYSIRRRRILEMTSNIASLVIRGDLFWFVTIKVYFCRRVRPKLDALTPRLNTFGLTKNLGRISGITIYTVIFIV